jgi:non-ribosomal peptide synthetase component E (peptide arylation enzyme)
MNESRPWRRFYGSVPDSLDYPDITLYEALAATARRVPDAIAWDFFGTRCTYRSLLAQIDRCAAAPAMQDALLAFCRERLIKWSCPREIEFVDALPTTKIGKVDYRALERHHAEAAATQERA